MMMSPSEGETADDVLLGRMELFRRDLRPIGNYPLGRVVGLAWK